MNMKSNGPCSVIPKTEAGQSMSNNANAVIKSLLLPCCFFAQPLDSAYPLHSLQHGHGDAVMRRRI